MNKLRSFIIRYRDEKAFLHDAEVLAIDFLFACAILAEFIGVEKLDVVHWKEWGASGTTGEGKRKVV
jgi:hypothetical protein